MSPGTTLEPIPQPPGYPILGNLFDMKAAETPIQALMKLARQYGPIFQLHVGPVNLIVVSGFDLVDEICDDKHYDKMLGRPAIYRRATAGDGFFTSWTQCPNWKKAHNILLPTFSMQSMKRYMPGAAHSAMHAIRK